MCICGDKQNDSWSTIKFYDMIQKINIIELIQYSTHLTIHKCMPFSTHTVQYIKCVTHNTVLTVKNTPYSTYSILSSFMTLRYTKFSI